MGDSTAPPEPKAGPVKPFLPGLLIAVVVSNGLLRSFHGAVPHGPELLGPAGSLLFWALIPLLAFHFISRRKNADLISLTEPGGGLSLPMVIPLMCVIWGEKWLTGDAFSAWLDRIDFSSFSPPVADALFRLITGLGLMLAAVALLPLLRQIAPRLRHIAGGARFGQALSATLWGCGAVLLLVLPASVLGSLHWGIGIKTAWGPAVLAQCVRAVAEELFYRGMLQTTLVWLLIEAGLPDRRSPRIIGITAVSLGFALEHLTPGLALRQNLSILVFVLGMSAALGTLLETGRNLFLPILGHVAINLLLIGAWPQPLDATGVPAVSPAVAGVVFLVGMMFGIAWRHRRRRDSAAGAGPDRPAGAERGAENRDRADSH